MGPGANYPFYSLLVDRDAYRCLLVTTTQCLVPISACLVPRCARGSQLLLKFYLHNDGYIQLVCYKSDKRLMLAGQAPVHSCFF